LEGDFSDEYVDDEFAFENEAENYSQVNFQ
jgi:hypothetical protein